MPDSLITTRSAADVATTVGRIETALHARGITLFATIDHAAGARSVGLELDDETVLIFGNPAAGTGLMRQDARVGIELPLRVLVWSRAGTTAVGYHDPHTLIDRYDLAGQHEVLDKLADLLAALVAEATAA